MATPSPRPPNSKRRRPAKGQRLADAVAKVQAAEKAAKVKVLFAANGGRFARAPIERWHDVLRTMRYDPDVGKKAAVYAERLLVLLARTSVSPETKWVSGQPLQYGHFLAAYQVLEEEFGYASRHPDLGEIYAPAHPREVVATLRLFMGLEIIARVSKGMPPYKAAVWCFRHLVDERNPGAIYAKSDDGVIELAANSDTLNRSNGASGSDGAPPEGLLLGRHAVRDFDLPRRGDGIAPSCPTDGEPESGPAVGLEENQPDTRVPSGDPILDAHQDEHRSHLVTQREVAQALGVEVTREVGEIAQVVNRNGKDPRDLLAEVERTWRQEPDVSGSIETLVECARVLAGEPEA